jgi:FkbM family methyltransferase
MKFYAQANTDRQIYEKYFKDKRDGFFVECGAGDGNEISVCKFFEESMGWTGINIECGPEHYEQLIKNRPLSRNIKAALSNTQGVGKFKNTIAGNGTPILCGTFCAEFHPSLTDAFSHLRCVVTEIDVECFKFSSLFTENRVIDLFVLDVEGWEVEALEGILDIDKSFYPIIFCIEKGHIEENKLYDLLSPYYVEDDRTEYDIIYKRKF